MHKKTFLGALVLAGFMALGYASSFTADDFSMAKAETSVSTTLQLGSASFTDKNGPYLNCPDRKGLPIDGSWGWRLFSQSADDIKIDGQPTKAGVPLVLYSESDWYLAIGDVGLGRTPGERSSLTLSGTWVGTYSGDGETYSATFAEMSILWTGSVWIEYYEDSQLETYERISLAQIGMEDTEGASIDFGNGNPSSLNTFVEREGNNNHNFSMVFKAKYTGPNVGTTDPNVRASDSALYFRVGSTSNWGAGHWFGICLMDKWGTHGVATFHEFVDDTIIQNSGDVLINWLDGEEHIYEFGVVKILNSNKFFRFVLEDNVWLYGKSFTLASDQARSSKVGVAYGGTVAEGTTVKLSNVIAQTEKDPLVFNYESSTANGLYFFHENVGPYTTSWDGPRFTPALKANFTKNGEPLARIGNNRAADVIVNYSDGKYYFALNDCGAAAEAGDVVTIRGEFHAYVDGVAYVLSVKPGSYRWTGSAWEEVDFNGALAEATIDDVPAGDPLRNIGLWKPDHSGHAVKNFDQDADNLVYRTDAATGKTGLYFSSSADKKSEVRFYLPDNGYKSETKGYAFHSVSFDYRVMKTNESVGTEGGDGLTQDGELTSTPSSTTTSFMIQLMNRNAKKYFCQDAPLSNDGHTHTFTLNINYADVVGFNLCLFNFKGLLFISNIQFDYLPYDEALNNFVVDSLKMFAVTSHETDWATYLPDALTAFDALSAEEQNLFNTDPAYASARNRFNTWKALKAAEELAAYKVAAKAQLDQWADAHLNEYRQAEQQTITAGIAAGKEAIDAATSIAAVDAIMAQLQQQLAAIKTDAQLTAEELAAAKTAAKSQLDQWATAHLAEYREAEQQQITAGIASGKEAIDAATTIAEVDAIMAQLQQQLATIKTAAEYEAEELAAYKVAAKAQLDQWADAHLNEYRQAEQQTITAGIAAGKEAIDAATSIAAVDAIMAQLQQQLAAIKTDAQLTAEELAAAKTAAKAELEAYKNADDYREAEQQQLAQIVADGKDAIDAANTIDEVNAALASAKQQLDALKTAAEYDAEELVAYKERAVTAITNYYETLLETGNYDDAGKAALREALDAAIAAINAATDKEGVNAAVTAGQIALDAVEEAQQQTSESEEPGESESEVPGESEVPTESEVPGESSEEKPAKKGGCGGSILATSAILTILALAGGAIVLSKKRKED